MSTFVYFVLFVQSVALLQWLLSILQRRWEGVCGVPHLLVFPSDCGSHSLAYAPSPRGAELTAGRSPAHPRVFSWKTVMLVRMVSCVVVIHHFFFVYFHLCRRWHCPASFLPQVACCLLYLRNVLIFCLVFWGRKWLCTAYFLPQVAFSSSSPAC